ncbi:hypothetical protein AAKU64_003847 [Undibacterium sp. GrIS 1.8]|uniref:hypothetical protein n=1 Tax=unclassified Undibacterium TaxID=2630295 RepID=UPI003398188A
MTIKVKSSKSSVKKDVNNGTNLLLPHDHDEVSANAVIKPDKKMKQAFVDLERGLVDTDLRGERGVEEVVTSKKMLKNKREIAVKTEPDIKSKKT